MNKNKTIAWWLLCGVILLMIQVMLGGITRLTGSGLSITEWKPLLGALPPTNETQWETLFEKYQHIAQFKILNDDFAISDFKFIYFWEWLHRNWARLISIVFLIPFFFFLYKKMITKEMIPKLIGLFALGLAQGLIGWIMVASGLNDENLYVSHIRLAVHFISALLLIAFTYWFALSLLIRESDKAANTYLHKLSVVILALLFVQLVYGAFMAGLKAANTAPTWPAINGNYIPPGMLANSFLNNPINIHFVHRSLAFLIGVTIIFWFLKARQIKGTSLFVKYRAVPLLLVLLQVSLGIITVLQSTHPSRNSFGIFEYMALFHQLTAMCLSMSFVWVLYITRQIKQ